ncbi:MAG: glucokinase, partial [Aquabacterium sp.]
MSASPGGPLPPAPWLLADIGGTNARFGWMAAHGQPVTLVRSLEVSQHAGPAAAVAAYLAGVAPLTNGAAPRSAALAVASAVGQAPFVMTNSGWLFDRAALARALGLEVLLLLNDFEALALSLP